MSAARTPFTDDLLGGACLLTMNAFNKQYRSSMRVTIQR
jgi:hypothetical protein